MSQWELVLYESLKLISFLKKVNIFWNANIFKIVNLTTLFWSMILFGSTNIFLNLWTNLENRNIFIIPNFFSIYEICSCLLVNTIWKWEHFLKLLWILENIKTFSENQEQKLKMATLFEDMILFQSTNIFLNLWTNLENWNNFLKFPNYFWTQEHFSTLYWSLEACKRRWYIVCSPIKFVDGWLEFIVVVGGGWFWHRAAAF